MFAHGLAAGLQDIEFPYSAVIQVWQHDVIAGGTESTRHVVQFFAFPGRVHQQKYHGMGAILLRVRDEGIHVASFRLYVYLSVYHGRSSHRGGLYCEVAKVAETECCSTTLCEASVRAGILSELLYIGPIHLHARGIVK